MKIKWDCGWDNSKIISPVETLKNIVKDYVSDSLLFSKSELWIDSIQQLMSCPLQPRPYHELESSLKYFIQEFTKFEDRISSRTMLNYVLRILIKYIIEYKDSYSTENGEESKWALLQIKKEFLAEYTEIVTFHIPEIDWEKCVCSLLIFARCMEGIYYEQLEKRFSEKDKQYEIMRCKDLLDFYKIYEYNFPFPLNSTMFNTKTNVIVVDHLNRKTKTLVMRPENLDDINSFETENNITLYLKNLYLSIINQV